MHSYSISTGRRIIVIAILAVLSGLIGQLINPYLWSVGLMSYGSLAIFGVLFGIFNLWAWDWPLIQNVVNIPNLSGKWEGTLIRPENNHNTERQVSMEIHQNFTQLSIVFRGERSTSRSTSATLKNDNKRDIQLHWTYFSYDQTGDANANLYGHGTTMLSMNESTLEGTYYSTKLKKGRLKMVRKK